MNRCSRTCLAAAVVAAAALPALADRAAGQQQPGSDRAGMRLSSSAMVVFQPRSGQVDVVGWSRDSVHVAVGERGGVGIELERFDGGVRIHERRPSADVESMPRYTLYVPGTANVRITLQAGRISLRRLVGDVRAGLVDGAVRGDSLAGRLDLSSVTGPVEVSRSQGEISARSVAGDVALINVAGSIRAKTTSGAIRIVVDTSGPVEAESYSGAIDFRGPVGGAASSFATHSGAIELRLPGGSDVTLFLTAIQGRASGRCERVTRFPTTGEPVPLGDGGSSVEVITFSGNIRVSCGG